MKENVQNKNAGEQGSKGAKEHTVLHPCTPAPLYPCTKITRSAEETFELARRIGERLDRRAVFLLSGDLGAGKTVFAKGIAAGLGIDPADVTSPSFTLVNVHEGRLRLYHIDLYRLGEGACPELGLDEILEEEKAVTMIEWAERLSFVPVDAIQVEIAYISDTERKLIIRPVAQK